MVGQLAKALHSIPLERPQDIATKGDGTIEMVSLTKIIGKGTAFTKQIELEDSVVASEGPKYTILEILSDTELVVKTYEKDMSKIPSGDFAF